MEFVSQFELDRANRSRSKAVPACLVITALVCCGVYLPHGDASVFSKEGLEGSLAGSPLSEEQKILHVLNRLTFGLRPGDVETVRSMGIAEYISRQFNPDSIDDSALERRLEGLETIHLSSGELAEIFRRQQEAQRARQSENRPDEDPAMETTSRAAPASSGDRARREAAEGVRKIALELQRAKILRAAYSERQLQELMTDFWFNHFNVFFGKGADRVFTTGYERDVIRPNALGNFHDLLAATAKSPAMLFYLDNWMSVDPEAKFPERFARLGNRRRPGQPDGGQPSAQQRRPRGLNENYARELMELHTLGVDGGYTQKDVTEVARCFTGWTLRNPRQGGGFQFIPFLHDNGEKTVMGKTLPAGGGRRDGETVLRMLAEHPSTARFISTKLCRRFVSDEPPAALVARCADTFLKTRGEIRSVLATIFSSPEFFSREAYRAKTKKPLELVVSALRATGAETQVHPRLLFALRSMGEPLYACQQPTGYPDTADAWINAGALLERINFATALAGGRLPATRTRLNEYGPAYGDDSALIAGLARELLGETPGPELLKSIEREIQSLNQGGGTPPRFKVIQTAALILGSPEFQRR